MEINTMRGWLLSVYPSDSWKQKVDKMPNAQIIAIYYSLLKRRKLEKEA